ncbi:MAG: CBASS cGAMP-activated phospholipase [Bdellovibrionota bacterium]|nr:CBASS cGAMP-activated phospholipase [Bdellovibrionota bacterium]
MAKEYFKILSIDGGGMRGVYPAHVLHCVKSRLGIDPTSYFDMYAGTSTGSIIAAGLACGRSPDEVVELYKKFGGEIFSPRSSWWPEKWKPAFHSLYNNDALKKRLDEIFQDIKLGDVSVPLLLPSTDIGHGGVHVFKSAYSAEFTRDNDVYVKDAVLASCSAPTFFDPVKIDAYALADGGLWANNPALAAVIDAQSRLGKLKEEIKILSLGTGLSKASYTTMIENKKWGLLNGWKGKDFINFLMSLQGQSTQNYLKLLLNPDHLLRVNFESEIPLPLDDCNQISDLISRADREFTHRSEEIKKFLNKGRDNAQ